MVATKPDCASASRYDDATCGEYPSDTHKNWRPLRRGHRIRSIDHVGRARKQVQSAGSAEQKGRDELRSRQAQPQNGAETAALAA